jgi:ATP-dependent RNA helicase SUPV3L1/SUV3
MEAVIEGGEQVPAGYRRAGNQAIRVDMAEKLFRAAHEQRGQGGGRTFALDTALPTSMGLSANNFASLMGDAGFRPGGTKALPEGAFGPPAPVLWSWRAPRKDKMPRRERAAPPREGSAFAALAGLIR